MGKIKQFIKQTAQDIDGYIKKAPERRKEEIQKLKDQLEIAKYKASIRKMEKAGRDDDQDDILAPLSDVFSLEGGGKRGKRGHERGGIYV